MEQRKIKLSEIGIFPENVWHCIFSFCSVQSLYYLSLSCDAFFTVNKSNISLKNNLRGYWGFIFQLEAIYYASANLEIKEDDEIEGNGMSTLGANAGEIKLFGIRKNNLFAVNFYVEFPKYDMSTNNRSRFSTALFRIEYNHFTGEYILNGNIASLAIHRLIGVSVVGMKVSKELENSKNFFNMILPVSRRRGRVILTEEEFNEIYGESEKAQEKLKTMIQIDPITSSSSSKKLIGTWIVELKFTSDEITFKCTLKRQKLAAHGDIQKVLQNGNTFTPLGDVLLCIDEENNVSLALGFSPKPAEGIPVPIYTVVSGIGELDESHKNIYGDCLMLDNSKKRGTFHCKKIM